MGFWLGQLRLFLSAIGFFTRIPVPSALTVDSDSLNKASRYFGLVGVVVGLISALVLLLAAGILPSSIAIVLAMISSVLVTGGFHEDGLADTADGFGGGWRVEDKLKIMKDSRLGSYGALALVLVLLLKYQLLLELALYDINQAALALVLAHCVSRVTAASIIFSETYVRDEGKSKPLAQQQGLNELGILLLTGIVLTALLSTTLLFWLLPTMLLLRWALVFWFRRQIGGYTGDTLGAAQQVSELVVYMLLLALGGSPA
ncbi:adenosylcobinamide-GDP ribazoletransferase [Shewanella algae]|uniref:adenosylcobinamide-GDP ribazoletransferase n=1 Tax=Shewanella algae TaxID=38313 RepID=UPI001186DADE|nr:adenosylcobinamide-GDP ribazoletransferase [Shewanella algae]MBO2644228.1 adenosylcobinamide-GDP ribazoletransferase [Shewanella algae]TVO83168.1 adenosylcobinamide-GDP ribazoletransferase [Shewanella algae]